MDIARIIGTIVATHKDASMKSTKICLIQPLDQDLNPQGTPLVATDANAKRGTGEIVFFVSSGDAVPTGPQGRKMPVDAAIMGMIDRIDYKKEYLPQ